MAGALQAMQGPIGITLITVISAFVVVGIVALIRRYCCKPAINYTAVNHGLDEEEMAFKKSMEQQHGDEIDELFNFSGQEELDFDPDELEHLEMLERRGKTSGAPGGVETGLGKEENGRVSGMAGLRSEGNGGAPSNAHATLHDTVREAEDLEALLEGGYRGGNATGGSGMEGGAAGSGKRTAEKGAATAKGTNGRA